jgi:hypothetical protein
VATLLVYVNNVELLQDTDTPVWSFVVLFVVFFVCEIVPIVILLDYSYYMQILREVAGAPLVPPQQQFHDNMMDLARNAEGDSLLLQRPLQTMDHLLLTSPHSIINSNNNIAATNPSVRSSPRRVRFQDTSQPAADDPFLEPT